MKARKLRALLPQNDYIIGDYGDYIGIGNDFVHKLIYVDKEYLYLKYALDTFHKGRDAIQNPRLEAIWDTLAALIKSGDIRDIMDGEDEIENPIPVFEARDGKVLEHVTDGLGWPNTTSNGLVMHSDFYDTKKEAHERALIQAAASLARCQERLEEKRRDVLEEMVRVKKYKARIKALNDSPPT